MLRMIYPPNNIICIIYHPKYHKNLLNLIRHSESNEAASYFWTQNKYMRYISCKSSVSVSVYYVAVRTIVLSRHGSNLARPVVIRDIIHGLIYVPSTPCCGFFWGLA